MIQPDDVNVMAEMLSGAGPGGDVESLLRSRFPSVRFTFCSTDDINVRRPVKALPGYEIYLYGGDHCLTLSNDFDAAHGVVVAEVDD